MKPPQGDQPHGGVRQRDHGYEVRPACNVPPIIRAHIGVSTEKLAWVRLGK
jgi:hypothetical protein